MVLNDLVDLFCYSQKNARLKGLSTLIFYSPTRISVFRVYLCVFIKILSLSLNTMLIVDKRCCDEFPVPQIDRNVNK